MNYYSNHEKDAVIREDEDGEILMTAEQAIQPCKYYKGEEECPFEAEEKDACFWWHGEQLFCDNLKRDPKTPVQSS